MGKQSKPGLHLSQEDLEQMWIECEKKFHTFATRLGVKTSRLRSFLTENGKSTLFLE